MNREIDVVTLTGAEYDKLTDERDDLQKELAAERERRKDAVRYDALCRALAGSWFYGNWMAETYNERMQEQMMRELGWWPITEDELVARGTAIDAAMSKERQDFAVLDSRAQAEPDDALVLEVCGQQRPSWSYLHKNWGEQGAVLVRWHGWTGHEYTKTEVIGVIP